LLFGACDLEFIKFMPTKKITKEESKSESAEKIARYFYAVGRRKSAVAKVKLFSAAKNELTVNGRDFQEYFPLESQRDLAKSPLQLAGENHFEVKIKAFGGGISAQSQAVRLGISRALIVFDESFKKSLKDKGYLTRDSREVERKKPGLKKARRAPQWAKR
jgi:small subunit ribosomal protein S9